MGSGQAIAFGQCTPANIPPSINESRSLFSPAQDHLALIRTDFLLGNAEV